MSSMQRGAHVRTSKRLNALAVAFGWMAAVQLCGSATALAQASLPRTVSEQVVPEQVVPEVGSPGSGIRAREGSVRTWLQVKGSDTIGEHLGQAFVREFSREQAAGEVRWESLGSSTGFVGLFDGSADVAASSRSIREAELERARVLGLRLREFVIAYDGIAVIVHPSNPVRALSLEQLGALFRGEIERWSEVGGIDAPVVLISRPSYSGTHGFFRDAVVRRSPGDSAAIFSVRTRFLEETDDIVRAVAADPHALSYVGLGFVADRTLATAQSVRMLALSSRPGSRPVAPDRGTVRDGSYPIYRPLYVYTTDEVGGDVRAFLSFMLSPIGQRLVSQHGFIPLDVASTVELEANGRRSRARSSAGVPLRVYFGFDQTELDREARRSLEEVAERMRGSERAVEVVGHADSTGSRSANRVVSQRRAVAAASYLEILGVPRARIRIAARGSDEPIATNDALSGRVQNRRVDVWILEDPADP